MVHYTHLRSHERTVYINHSMMFEYTRGVRIPLYVCAAVEVPSTYACGTAGTRHQPLAKFTFTECTLSFSNARLRSPAGSRRDGSPVDTVVDTVAHHEGKLYKKKKKTIEVYNVYFFARLPTPVLESIKLLSVFCKQIDNPYCFCVFE